jgi:hypothetical protein
LFSGALTKTGWLVVTAAGLWGLIKLVRKGRSHWRIKMETGYLATYLVGGLVVLSFYQGDLFDHYLWPLYILGLILAVRIIRVGFGQKWLGALGVGLIMTLTGGYLCRGYLRDWGPSPFEEKSRLVKLMMADLEQQGGDQADLGIWEVLEDYETFGSDYWFLLEQMTGRRLLTFVDQGSRLEPIKRQPDYLYVVCGGEGHRLSGKDDCLTRFETGEMKGKYTLQAEIYANEQRKIERIYRMRRI